MLDTTGYRARIFENGQRLDFNDQLPEHESRWERTGKILQPTDDALKSVWNLTLARATSFPISVAMQKITRASEQRGKRLN